MCVYIYIYIYITYIHTYTYVYIYIYILHTYVYIYIYTLIIMCLLFLDWADDCCMYGAEGIVQAPGRVALPCTWGARVLYAYPIRYPWYVQTCQHVYRRYPRTHVHLYTVYHYYSLCTSMQPRVTASIHMYTLKCEHVSLDTLCIPDSILHIRVHSRLPAPSLKMILTLTLHNPTSPRNPGCPSIPTILIINITMIHNTTIY